MNSASHQRLVVLFDGVCNLCNAGVDFIVRHDRFRQIQFETQQSEAGKKLLLALPPAEKLSSIIFVERKQVWTESTAVLMICKYLDGFLKLGVLFLLIPPFFRDMLYRLIARNRYKWFGKRKTCRVL